MKLSVLANLYAQYPLEETLAKLKALGVEAAEIGAGGYPGKAHCDPEKLLASPADFEKFKDAFKKYDIELCALSCHGNPCIPTRPRQSVTMTILSTPFFSPRSSDLIP